MRKRPENPIVPPKATPSEARQVARQLVDHLITAAREAGATYPRRAFADAGNSVRLLDPLAQDPDHALAAEFALPATALIRAIAHFAQQAERVGRRAREAHREAWVEAADRVRDQLHLALAVAVRGLLRLVSGAARGSRDRDLLCEAAELLVGDGREAAKLLEHYVAVAPDEFEPDPDEPGVASWVATFAWDTFQRVAALDQLAERFPALIRPAAREMNAWPMLRHRHTDSNQRFQSLAQSLELGANHPLGTSKRMKHRPGTPLGRYLAGLVLRLHDLRQELHGLPKQSVESRTLAAFWCESGEAMPGEPVLAALRVALRLKPLTKSNAKQWATQVIVPYILGVDARDAETCCEPAFLKIWRQQGKCGKVKSLAEFKSRLTPDLVKQLRSMARPG